MLAQATCNIHLENNWLLSGELLRSLPLPGLITQIGLADVDLLSI